MFHLHVVNGGTVASLCALFPWFISGVLFGEFSFSFTLSELVCTLIAGSVTSDVSHASLKFMAKSGVESEFCSYI